MKDDDNELQRYDFLLTSSSFFYEKMDVCSDSPRRLAQKWFNLNHNSSCESS